MTFMLKNNAQAFDESLIRRRRHVVPAFTMLIGTGK